MANEVKVKDIGQLAITNMLNQVENYAALDNSDLSSKEKQYATSIIININKKVVAASYETDSSKQFGWNDLDITGCQLPAQIKRFAKLNLSIENQEIFLDIRNNGKTHKKDINLKLQYQGLEKLLMTYCSKKIIRFCKDVVCKGDKLTQKRDLSTGLTLLKEHEYFDTDDINYRNKLENITGAYAIAYVKENENDTTLTPYVAFIDKNRIERAKKAAMTQNIWNADTRKMVIKTAVIELYNMMKPYMKMPEDLAKELNEISSQEVDFNKDFINADCSEVKAQVEKDTTIEEEVVANDLGEVQEAETEDDDAKNKKFDKYLADDMYD